MGLSRNQLAAELWGLLQRQFAEVGIANEDTSGNLKEPVDATLSAFDVAYADLANTGELILLGSERDAIVVARYYGLRAVYDAAINRTDIQMSASAPSVSRSQNYSQYVRQLEDSIRSAKADAANFLPADGWGAGSVSLGFIPGCSDLDDYAEEWAS